MRRFDLAAILCVAASPAAGAPDDGEEGRALAAASVAGEPQLEVTAASVHWRKDGSGPALVLLHGFPLSGGTWDAVVAQLHDRFTCYTPDLIGLGRSRSSADDDHSSPGQARALKGCSRSSAWTPTLSSATTPGAGSPASSP